MPRPVNKRTPVISTRLVFLLLFTLFYWGVHFISEHNNLQLSQVVFDIIAGIFAGAMIHVAVAKFLGPLFFGRGFCGWVCWNASFFELLPVSREKKRLPEKFYMYKYGTLVAVLVLPVFFLAAGHSFTSPDEQFKWLLAENALIYLVGLFMALRLGDRRAFCKYLCPAGALMTFTAPKSIIKVEKNHLRCNRCRKCEEVCPMDVPVLDYITAGNRVSDPECILCTECVKNCLTVGIGKKSDTTPEFGKSY